MTFKQVVDLCISIFTVPISINGITFNLQQVFIFVLISTVLLAFIYRIMR